MSIPTVEVPKSGVIRCKTGAMRVFKVLRSYRNEKGQPTCDKVLIGRLDPNNPTRMFPNGNYYDYYETPELSLTPPTGAPSGVKSIGASYLVSRVLRDLGVDSVLREVFSDRADWINAIAQFMTCRGNAIERIADWSEESSLRDKLSPQSASTLFSTISFEERLAFFKAWSAHHAANDFLAYDVTSFSTYAKKIEDSEWGYIRDGEKLPQINMGHYFSYQTGLPIFYVTYPGSIIDKSHMKYIMSFNDDLVINNVLFVMDRGFYSTLNIQWLHNNNIKYIITVDLFNKAACAAINEARGNIDSINNIIDHGVFGKTISSRFYGVKSETHVFYSRNLKAIHETSLYRRIELKEEQLKKLKTITPKEAKKFADYFDINIQKDCSFTYSINADSIDEKNKYNGYYCILSNSKIDIKDVYTIYNRRNIIEKSFDNIKNFVSMKIICTHNDAATEGKLFCAFISMIAASRITEKLRIINKSGGRGRWSKDSVIFELEKVKAITFSDGRARLLNPLTKTQRELYAAFGINETELYAYVKA
jgi:hypothetical protein